jgi:hypothetical protein
MLAVHRKWDASAGLSQEMNVWFMKMYRSSLISLVVSGAIAQLMGMLAYEFHIVHIVKHYPWMPQLVNTFAVAFTLLLIVIVIKRITRVNSR